MKGNFKNVNIFLLFDFLIFILFIIGIYNFAVKAELPFQISFSENQLVITNTNSENLKHLSNEVLKSINSIEFNSREEIEVYLDSKKIGDNIEIEILKNNFTQKLNISLIPFYSALYIIIAILVGITFFVTGFIVLIKSKNKEVGVVFHWCMVTTASIILMTWGNFTKINLVLGILTRSGFHFGYALVPTFFLHFSFLFPIESKINFRKFLPYLYLFSSLFAILLSIIFIKFANYVTIENIRLYINFFDISSVYVVIIILTAIFIQFKNYFSTNILEIRKKLRWILLGYILGPFSYLFFWVIPQRFTSYGLIPEEIVLLLVAAVPITFAIAIIKYQVMDIEIIIRRTLVYPIAISILVIAYFGFFSILVNTFNLPNPKISSIIAAIFIALIFHPLKEFVKKFVNKKIFKVEYDYRKAINNFLDEIKEINELQKLEERVVNFINKIIPVDKIGIFNYEENKYLKLAIHYNYREISENKIEINSSIFSNNLFRPIFSKHSTIAENNFYAEFFNKFGKFSFEIIFPIKSSLNEFIGILVLGEKKSKLKFSLEDLDLLNTIVAETGNSIERIKLQEQLYIEKIEKQRLSELNELKSFFVSSVSHDLKTPLTSIKMFAEILKSSENISNEKVNQYLEIIEGESNRLTRLIDNVLNYSKIERGIKVYNFEKIDLNLIVSEVIKSTEYLFKIQNFSTQFKLSENELNINADKDAVVEAIINLISNSIKFSKESKFVKLSTYRENNFAVVTIEDKGIGISSLEQEKLFEPYFQSRNLNTEQLTGAGLGLTIVKHIIDAHNGKIEFESRINEGTIFKLYFQIMEYSDESNFNN
ncbi:MAG: hypothetical protein IPM32_12105 [Ignavibacteriae bacterium]|nr:hypothetical protein [Ignavibacteriota bacterium]